MRCMDAPDAGPRMLGLVEDFKLKGRNARHVLISAGVSLFAKAVKGVAVAAMMSLMIKLNTMIEAMLSTRPQSPSKLKSTVSIAWDTKRLQLILTTYESFSNRFFIQL